MSDPFGEAAAPWWRRLWRRERADGAPKRYAVPAGAAGPIAALLVSSHGMDVTSRVAFWCAVSITPPALVEFSWRQRRRRADEELLIFPEDQVPD
jgi:hypothetical protein